MSAQEKTTQEDDMVSSSMYVYNFEEGDGKNKKLLG